MKKLAFALVLALVAAPALRAEEEPSAKPVTVPFEMLRSGHMTVMVKVNGKGPYKLIFDTGAPVTLLNNKIAKDAGLPQRTSLFSPGDTVKVKTLEVGEQKAENVTALVMDHPTVEAISKAFMKEAGPIDGIVGFPFFARFKMTLDYKAKKMTFTPNGYNPPDVMQALTLFLMDSAAGKQEPKVLAPAAQWGLIAEKGSEDEDAGVTIKEVLPGSAAAAAGLKKGDRLLTLDGRWTDTLPDLYTAAGYVKPGTTVAVVVKRDGKDMEFKVKPVSGL
jgi:membrane-associated protease RseP (regulator of RpoE activity)